MTSAPNLRHRFLRGHRRLLALGVGIVALSVVATPVAFANLSGSSFEGGDGNLVVNTSGNTDWANVAGRNVGIDQPSGSTDNAFGQGTKEDVAAVTVVDGSIPPNKNDLTRFYEASEFANGSNYLYLGWERLVNIGNANLDFEINQKKTAGFTGTFTGPITLNRTAGDVLVTYDFGGSGTPTLGLDFWLTAAAGNTVSQCFSANALPCWGKHVSLNGTNSEGAVNTASVLDPISNQTLGVGLFGEAAINLTAAGVFPAGTCEAFGSAFVKSRSSSSFTAEIKDFIAPIAVNISNCGTITIHKVTENGDASFGYTTTGGLTPSTFSLSNGGTQSYSAVPVGSYTVVEGSKTDWTLANLVCGTVTGSGTSATTSLATATVSITMAAGGNVDCTYTNHTKLQPSITTALSSSTITIGGTVRDTATLSGATADAGGTVTYSAYAGANTCSGTDLLNSTVTVTNGGVPNSADFTPAATGTYSFQAVYSGDGNNFGATSDCTTEQLVVNKAQPSNSTAQTLLPNDSFTLSGGFSPSGSVTFNLYSPSDATCSSTPAYTETVPVSGNGTYSTSNTSFLATAAGTWRWQDAYSGDSNNNGTTSACGVEQFTIVNH